MNQAQHDHSVRLLMLYSIVEKQYTLTQLDCSLATGVKKKRDISNVHSSTVNEGVLKSAANPQTMLMYSSVGLRRGVGVMFRTFDVPHASLNDVVPDPSNPVRKSTDVRIAFIDAQDNLDCLNAGIPLNTV